MYRLHSAIMASGDGLEAAVRSLSPAAWYQPGVGITGSLTVSNWADQSGNGRDLAQGTAGNQPINLPHTGTAYAYLPGVAGNYFSTPDSVANSITGDIDLRFYLAANDWTPAGPTIICAKDDGGANRDILFYVTNAGGALVLATSPDGSTLSYATSSIAPTVSDGNGIWVRATRVASSGVVKFYTSTDAATTSPGSVTFTQLGTDQSNTAGAIYNGVANLEVGSSQGGSNPFLGKFYRGAIYNGINGTLAVDFSPSTFAETSTNGATATASTGEVWTLNSTGAKPAQIVKSAQLMLTNAAGQYMTATYGPTDPQSLYMVFKQNSWTLNNTVFSSAGDDMNISQQTATPKVGLFAGSAAAENADAALGSFAIGCFLFNAAGSLVQINAGTATTGNPGSVSGATINLSRSSLGADFQVKELIAFSAAHDATQRAAVRNYLAVAHGVAL